MIFADELDAIAERSAELRVVCFLGGAGAGLGRFDEAKLREAVPDFPERELLLCGPTSLMERVRRLAEQAGCARRIRCERFGLDRVAIPTAAPPVAIRLARSGVTLPPNGGGTVLEQLERGGARPAFGCRMGICQTCKCRKQSGAVRNLVTGAVSTEAEEDIQPCISLALSDLELRL
jgi:ferredoxin